MISDWPQMKALHFRLVYPGWEQAKSWDNEVLKAHGKLWVWWRSYVDAALFKSNKD
jgi:hypothetical protein